MHDNFENIEQKTSSSEDDNKRKGLLISLVLHLLILLLFIIPVFLVKGTQPQEPSGILIAFGDPDAGNSEYTEQTEEDVTKPSANASPASSAAESNFNQESDEVEIVRTSTEAKKEPTKPKENTKEAEERKRNEAEALAKKKAQEEADRKAKEMESKKKQYSDLFGSGKGNGQNTGNAGTDKGDPNGQVLDGISKGSGRIGGGLNGRGVEFEPNYVDKSQKVGRIVLTLCVGKDGKVASADYTQKGSTSSDAYLIDLARKTSLKYRFVKSEIEKQCGTVTVDFKVQ